MWHGGDFDNSSASGSFLNTTAQTGSPIKKAARHLQSIVPVVNRQIIACDDEAFKLFGINVQFLTVVGILRDYEVRSTKAIYNIEDHTGSIKAVWWLQNNDDNTLNLPAVKEGSYLQIFGSFRNRADDKFLMILRMFPVDDANAITNHLLQAIHARLAIEAMSKSSILEIKEDNRGETMVNFTNFADETMPVVRPNGLTPLQEKVYQILSVNNAVPGASRQYVINQFPANQNREVNVALDFLINEGHVYSTIDNDHFRVSYLF